jgi:MarR family transcriptional regulator for hemolysin
MGYTPSFGHRINIVGRLYAKRLNERIQKTGITGSQWSVINRLLLHGTLTQAEICEQLSIEAPTISKTLDAMEKSGWIRRTIGEDDRREKKVTLSAQAMEQLPVWMQIVQELQNQALGNLSDAEIDMFGRVLEQVFANLQGK